MSLQGYRHVEDIDDCKCDECQGGVALVAPSIKKKKARGAKKTTVKGKTGSSGGGSDKDGLSDEAFEAAQASIAAAKRGIHSLMFADTFHKLKLTDEYQDMLEKLFPDSTEDVSDLDMFLPFCTAVPKKKGRWGSWDVETHLEAFKDHRKKSGYHFLFDFCASDFTVENPLFYTACCQLESLESDRTKYFDLFDEIYETFIHDDAPLMINIDYQRRRGVQKVISTYRYIPEHTIDCMDAARRAARLALYDTLFHAFREQKSYKKKKDKQVDRFDTGPKRPNPNIDYWFHDGKKNGFTTFRKFAKKNGEHFVNLLDFYTACRELQRTNNQDLFVEICVKYINPKSENRVEGIGRVLMEDIGLEYLLTVAPRNRVRRVL